MRVVAATDADEREQPGAHLADDFAVHRDARAPHALRDGTQS
jgi:hypothetical protein